MATDNAPNNHKPAQRVDIPEALDGLAVAIDDCDVGNEEAFVKIGIRLEKAWTDLRVNGADKPVLELLKTCLQTLQQIYQKTVSDVQGAWDAVRDAIAAVEAVLGGDDSAADRAAAAGQAIQAVLQGDDVPAERAQQAADGEAEAPQAANAKGDSSPRAALCAIQDVSARLVAADPSDGDELKAILEDVHTLMDMTGLAAAASGHLTMVATQLETVIQGKVPDPQKTLDTMAGAIGTCADVQETFIEADGDDLAEASETTGEPDDDEAPEPAADAQTPEADTETYGPDGAATAADDKQPATEEPAEAKPASKAPPIEFPGPAVMGEDCDPELMKEFIIECLDHITNAEGALLELESNPEDNDQINVVFRAFHTIKGTSGFLNLDRIQTCAHLAENLLDRARDGEIRILGGYADLALRSCDCLRVMIEGLQGLTPGDDLTIPEDLSELLEILSDPEGAGYDEDDVDDTPMRTGDILVAGGKITREHVEQAETEKGQKHLGEKLLEDKAVKAKDVAGAIRKQKAQQQRGASSMAEGSVRVSTGRLDSLINMVGELVIAQSMVAQDPSVMSGQAPRLQRNVSHAGKITRELQDLTMSLRMVPLKGIFQKMNRLVRDLARKSGKKVKFVTEGEETEIDRNMVESLNDPLVHMIRNSVDHGVESPDVRETNGKEPSGTVTLRAYHAAGNVVIELQDDGKGLDRERILAKASERGLLDGKKDLSDQEAFMLIFQAGFSTAEKVTDVSGRGVGMDVVKRSIESLRGRIEVASKQGAGSTFSIRLPLTMAIADAMILRVGQETYLLPTVSIEQSFQPGAGSISTVSGKGEMVMLRGELLPLFRLHELFDVPQASTEPYESLLVVIEGDGHRCALMVDELLGQQQVVIKSLGRGMAKVPGVSGGAILGDGRVGLILDATGLLQLAEGRLDNEPEAAMA
ncbi:MAG: chemotaxis protein CheA [Planctomycetes bacterium]|jgi:two-component system chemotaxis sensor kinase CheA|nr:chemotaxis protein CheW [Phycisphaerae bacterium]NBB95536.1 chemotaxis protein CheA [Planctomycetota bacterium]